MLVERGWSIAAAGSTISIVLWLAVLSVPTGGLLADRIKRPQLVLVAGCILFALLMVLLPRSSAVVSIVVALGLISGQPAGPIMSLPARVLQPATRAVGMGIFYTFVTPAMLGTGDRWRSAVKWVAARRRGLRFRRRDDFGVSVAALGF